MKTERLEIFERIMSMFSKDMRVLDIATGHGKFANKAKALGFTDITAIDARSDRVPNTHGIKWIVDNILNIDTSEFNLILCFGILYHFNNPQELLDKCKHSITIVDTHYSETKEVEHLGYFGSFYKENNTCLTASFEDSQSFWPEKSELIKLLNENYSVVSEVTPNYLSNRTFFICLP